MPPLDHFEQTPACLHYFEVYFPNFFWHSVPTKLRSEINVRQDKNDVLFFLEKKISRAREKQAMEI